MRWDNSTNSWINKWKSTLSYDNNGSLLADVFWEVWDKELEIWETHSQEIYTYNSNDKLEEKLTQNWSNTTNDWVNYKNIYYSYDENAKLVEEVWKDWNLNEEVWIMTFSYSYFYDANDFLIEEIRKHWEEELSQWVPQYSYLFSNDEAGNILERLKKYWDDLDSTWINGSNYIYYNSVHQTTNITTNHKPHDLVIYPNPANSSIYILNDSLLEFELTLINSSGQKLFTKRIKNKQEHLDLINLQKGVYFLQFHSKEKGQFVEKLIKN